MNRILALLFALAAVFAPLSTHADPADVNAAARGVVRVVIIGSDGDRTYPISHGTGFAVTPTQIVTNAHVVSQAQYDDTLRIAIVPSGGEGADFARQVAVSPRNDLALVQIIGDLRLPPLTVSGESGSDSGEVSAVGYPKNVDMAQGLGIEDIFKSQPPVKSQGFLSGRRPSRLFDTLLHTAPIGAGNSGGPLLDNCGRVLGVNSFGADSSGTDAEFFFAVSTRELLPFLRTNDIEPRVSSTPCRSIAELDADERTRMDAQQAAARSDLNARAEETRLRRNRAQLEAEQSVAETRENAMAIAALLLLLGVGAGFVAWQGYRSRGEAADDYDVEDDYDSEDAYDSEEQGPDDGASGSISGGGQKRTMIAGTISAVAIIASLAMWFTRPGLDEIDRRVAAAMNDAGGETGGEQPVADASPEGTLLCTLEPSRSRITGAPDQQLEFSWEADGCVNDRTQYGLVGGDWARVFVPNEEDAVSVNRYDPNSQTFRTDRYLLGRSAITTAREARGKYSPPACDATGAASELGDMQGAVTALLPERPNERLVYSCGEKNP